MYQLSRLSSNLSRICLAFILFSMSHSAPLDTCIVFRFAFPFLLSSVLSICWFAFSSRSCSTQSDVDPSTAAFNFHCVTCGRDVPQDCGAEAIQPFPVMPALTCLTCDPLSRNGQLYIIIFLRCSVRPACLTCDSGLRHTGCIIIMFSLCGKMFTRAANIAPSRSL